jgi:hypothetical protein
VISFEFREFRIYKAIAPFLSVREWNGIDRPEYFKIFKVTHDECNLKGRFTLCQSINGSKSPYCVRLDASVNLEESITWIAENIHQPWAIDVESVFGNLDDINWVFSFNYEEDAVLFRLSWS